MDENINEKGIAQLIAERQGTTLRGAFSKAVPTRSPTTDKKDIATAFANDAAYKEEVLEGLGQGYFSSPDEAAEAEYESSVNDPYVARIAAEENMKKIENDAAKDHEANKAMMGARISDIPADIVERAEAVKNRKYAPEVYTQLTNLADKYGITIPEESMDGWLDFFAEMNQLENSGLKDMLTNYGRQGKYQ